MTILTCYDVFGRRVRLADSTWFDHIQSGHPETRGNERALEITLVSPEQVNFDARFSNREVFYRRGALPPPDKEDVLKVVVQYFETDDGEMIGDVRTAYAVTDIPSEEPVKWTRN